MTDASRIANTTLRQVDATPHLGKFPKGAAACVVGYLDFPLELILGIPVGGKVDWYRGELAG